MVEPRRVVCKLTAVAAVVLVEQEATVLARQVAQVVRLQRTTTRVAAFLTLVAVVAVEVRLAVRAELMQGMAALVLELMELLTVVVVVVVLTTQQAKVLAARVVLSFGGSPQKQQAQVLLSQRQARQRTELTVLTLGMRGIPQELWWFRNGTFRKDRERCGA
jgi:hypothetical protein